MNPVKASLKFPQVTLILTAMLFAVGIHALLTMPRREDPKITIRVGLVSAIYPGATAEQVEDQISRRLEQRIFRFEEVRKDKTYSTSRNNVAIVYVQLEDSVKDTDKFWAKLRNDLAELKARELPSTVQGPVVNSDFGDTVAVLLAISGERYGYRALKDYAERIEDELRTIRAVSKLKRFGEQKEQIEISSSLERISQYATNPLRVIGALQARNAVQYAGKIELGKDAVPINTSGLFTNEEEIRRTLVDVSPTGQPVHLGDIADVRRRYADPTELIRFKGEPSLLLSVEMQEGNNIVEFGKQVRQKLDYLKTQFPPDLNIDLIADQPKVVEDRVSHFIREFGIAIGAVILVTIILLPIRVAVISALAIPVTVAVTFGVMNTLHIELHQVSISALIVVLGMVVDDAIVIADNYVELLDRGVARPEAAWRSATELAVPVLTATLTIIAAFMPLLMLSGSVGEFISALPIAVAVALASSFIVAMLVTPLLCQFFIRRGLHAAGADPHKKKFSALDLMQGLYGRTIALGMKYKALAVALGVAAFVLGVVLLHFVPEQFFPSAERNQFVTNVWMPEGTRIDATDAVLRRLEGNLAASPEVRDYATFTGTSAPRFYYNVNPEPSATNFGQLLVNTRSAEQTPGFVDELRTRFARLAPEALVMVMELQQGQRMDAPIEVRVTGDDLTTLESLGEKVKDLVRDTPGAAFVHTDFHEDSYHVKVDIDTEVANRLGLTNASIAQLLAGAFDGAPISTYWEGDRAVDVVLRLDPAHRSSFGDIRNAYMISTLSSARVPLREVASLRPDWDPSRIIRRNGVRTLTVRSFFDRGQLASGVLKRVQSKIAAIPLPAGYRIDYGGEAESQKETFAEMVKALMVSLVIIYLILLFQFRSVMEPVIVMLSIPLSLGGAALGLILTGNPFGFTAFMGVISLSGIVVRNAIILVDYIRERMKEGVALEEAALEAGQRRLRPIFLTTMAAAVGVTPMILSGSSLWSPLASVIAIGLLFSMFFTLVVVPVIYVLLMRRHTGPPVAAVVTLLALLAAGGASAQTRSITLEESVDLALKQNSLLKIARAKIREAEGKRQAARANYFPHLTNETNYMRLAQPQSLSIPAGLLGNPTPLAIVQGATQFFYTTTTLAQPVTQLVKIRQGDLIARLDIAIATADVTRAEREVALKVQEAYFGRLIAERQRRSAELRIAAEEEHLRTASDAVEAGVTLEVSRLSRRASLLESRHARLELDNQIADVGEEFNDLLGLPLDTPLELRAPDPPPAVTMTLAETVAAALKENPELRAASLNLAKAQRAVVAARAEFIPEVGIYGQQAYQNGVPFVAKNDGIFGIRMIWDVFDFGKRGGVVHERQALVEQAAENVRRHQRRVALDVQSRYRKLDRARMMMDVAAEALALRREADRLSADQLTAGVILSGARQDASVALAKAEADQLRAQLGYRLALADLERVVGRSISGAASGR